MTLLLKIRSDARSELDSLLADCQAYSPSVALKLMDDLERALAHIAEFPEIGRAYYRSLRVWTYRRHHILILYAVLPDHIQVFAFIDSRSDPARIRRILRKRLTE